MTSRLLALAALAILTTALAACSRDREVHARGNMTLAEAERFAEFPLYFAGDAVGGHELEAILRLRFTSPNPHTEVRFLYGTCEVEGFDGGCAVPLTVILWPACYRYDKRYSIPERERVTVRGVPGRLRRGDGGESPRLELYPADVTIVVNDFSGGEVGSLVGVARQLRGLNRALPESADLPDREPRVASAGRCRT